MAVPSRRTGDDRGRHRGRGHRRPSRRRGWRSSSARSAPVLVKRSAASCADTAQLWQRLAEHTDKPADRAAFLRQAPQP